MSKTSDSLPARSRDAVRGRPTKADAVTDWDVRSGTIVAESGLGTPPAIRVLALAHCRLRAVNAITDATRRAPSAAGSARRVRGAAVAAAHRATLMKLMPARQASIDAAYQSAFTASRQNRRGMQASRSASGLPLRCWHRGATTCSRLKPTDRTPRSGSTCRPRARRSRAGAGKPLMANASHFRPGPPPSLSGDAWARDYEEVRVLGARSSERRSAEQTAIARFWEYSLPPIYHGVVRSVATLPGREITRNARLYAAVTQAMDDAMIGVFDAKYHYNFWRPVTAIRNGALDGHDATERDASWAPLADVPMHPEYPSAHSILAAAVGTVLRAEIGAGPTPMLGTASPTAKGAARHWTSIDDFVREVSDARIYEGIHFRTSTEVGVEMGERIGALAVVRYLALPRASVGPAVTGRGR